MERGVVCQSHVLVGLRKKNASYLPIHSFSSKSCCNNVLFPNIFFSVNVYSKLFIPLYLALQGDQKYARCVSRNTVVVVFVIGIITGSVLPTYYDFLFSTRLWTSSCPNKRFLHW